MRIAQLLCLAVALMATGCGEDEMSATTPNADGLAMETLVEAPAAAEPVDDWFTAQLQTVEVESTPTSFALVALDGDATEIGRI